MQQEHLTTMRMVWRKGNNYSPLYSLSVNSTCTEIVVCTDFSYPTELEHSVAVTDTRWTWHFLIVSLKHAIYWCYVSNKYPNPLSVWTHRLKSKILIEFHYYRLNSNVNSFDKKWNIDNSLFTTVNGEITWLIWIHLWINDSDWNCFVLIKVI